MTEEEGKKSEKYIEEMKRITKEAQADFEKGMREVDRLGKMFFEDVKEGLKDSSKNLNKVKETVKADMDREVPIMVAEMKQFQAKMEKHLKDLQEEVRKAIK